MRYLPVLINSLLFCPVAIAALPSNAGQAVAFYREKESSFASGQASRTALQNRIVQTDVRLQYHCKWDNRDFILNASQILTELDVAQFVDSKTKLRLHSLPRSEAAVMGTFSEGQKFKVISFENPWVRVREIQTKTEGWVLASQVRTRHDDLGFYSNLIRTPLRAEALQGSSILTFLPQQSRLIPVAFEKDFIKVQYKDYVGYADVTHFVSRLDFATFAFHPTRKWIAVRHRVGSQMQSRQNEFYDLKSLKGFVTSSKQGIVIHPDNSSGPPLQAHIEIQKPKAFIWAQSKISGHGLVWWKKQEEKILVEPLNNLKAMTTNDLMKSEVFDFALESNKSVRGLVSSNGIYRTEDGENWQRIEMFGNNRHPIAIHPNGTWFVGAYSSRDGGKTFEPFIRWDNIAHAIEAAAKGNPRVLRINKIETLPNSRVAISVDTGNNQEVKLQSLIGDFRWEVLRR